MFHFNLNYPFYSSRSGKKKAKTKKTGEKKMPGSEDQLSLFSPEEDMMLAEGEVPPKFRHTGPNASEMKKRMEKREAALSKAKKNAHNTSEKRVEL